MAAEVSAASAAYEHTDFVRAAWAELVLSRAPLCHWRVEAAKWRLLLVLDARCAYDSLNSDHLPTDRKVALDVAVLREALTEEGANLWVRCVPGHSKWRTVSRSWVGTQCSYR